MKSEKMIVDGKLIEVMRFKKYDTAKAYQNKKQGREMVFMRAREFYVSK